MPTVCLIMAPEGSLCRWLQSENHLATATTKGQLGLICERQAAGEIAVLDTHE